CLFPKPVLHWLQFKRGSGPFTQGHKSILLYHAWQFFVKPSPLFFRIFFVTARGPSPGPRFFLPHAPQQSALPLSFCASHTKRERSLLTFLSLCATLCSGIAIFDILAGGSP